MYKGPIKFLITLKLIQTTLELLGIYALTDESSISWLINKIKPLCDQALFEEYVCSNLMFIIGGPEPNKDIFNFVKILAFALIFFIALIGIDCRREARATSRTIRLEPQSRTSHILDKFDHFV